MPQVVAKRSSVLIIDHSIDIHRVLKIRLRDQNLTIDSALSAADGLRLARLKHPDLILLESNLPEMSGFELLATLKDDPETVDIPVIFLSDSHESSNKVRGFDLGAVDFVTKPFDVPELRSRVRSALRTQRLVQLLAQRAQVDGLTGLWNRAYFDKQLRQAINTAKRHSRPLSLIIADLDHFKQVNDRYGHPFGDVVIQGFAHRLEEGSRASDIPCRFGGEEFAIILPDTDVASAEEVAERYRTSFESMIWAEHESVRLTASFGIASLDALPDRDPRTMIESADQALYRAKQDGRNLVRVAQPFAAAATAAASPKPRSKSA